MFVKTIAWTSEQNIRKMESGKDIKEIMIKIQNTEKLIHPKLKAYILLATSYPWYDLSINGFLIAIWYTLIIWMTKLDDTELQS